MPSEWRKATVLIVVGGRPRGDLPPDAQVWVETDMGCCNGYRWVQFDSKDGRTWLDLNCYSPAELEPDGSGENRFH